MPLRNRRSSTSSSSSRPSPGSARLPAPTRTGTTKSSYSSTNPALIACAASSGPPTARSWFDCAFSCRMASTSKSCSIRVLAVRAVLERPREDDLVRGAPELGELLHVGRLLVEARGLVPVRKHLVHPAPEQIRADRAREAVDERVDLLVGLGPVELALLVRDEAVERSDRRVDQAAHGRREMIRTAVVA